VLLPGFAVMIDGRMVADSDEIELLSIDGFKIKSRALRRRNDKDTRRITRMKNNTLVIVEVLVAVTIKRFLEKI
jgi:hypothetical protein